MRANSHFTTAVFCLIAGFASGEHHSQCGGTLTAKHGVIQTPGFPNEFQVPISCQWVIDASEYNSPNTSIVIYLTQLFVSEGLSFDEYETYDWIYSIVGKRIHTVLENNVSKVKLISTNLNVLVVNFELTSIENTHLRILDYFLDVYGFNITYEIITEPIRHDSCIMSDCGFTGTCLYDYSKFYCRCFMGYSGPTCSNGPNSLCSSDGTSFCQNGGICRLVGTTLASCNCAEGYTGERCETKIDISAKNNCITHEWDRNCNNCSTATTDAELSTRLRMMQGPSLKKDSLKEIIKDQLFLFKIKFDQVSISELNYYEWGTEAVVNFYGVKKDKKRLETLLNRWKQSGSLGSLTLLDKNSYNESRLSIKSVSVDQTGLIREGDRYILSCVAHGSPRMTFKWYKDGIAINVTRFTSNKWVRLIQDTHVRNQYTGLLGIDEASYLDEGFFVCEVEDYGIRQCLGKKIDIRRPPPIKIEPMTLTVQRGENFTIKCISLSKTDSSKYTYSWTKNKGLLPIKTEMEKYEILFPGGSILQVSKIERPTMYSCLVQDQVTSSEVSIQVDVIDRALVRACRGEKHMNILWPETAPGTQSVQECPKGFIGVVTRWCILHDPEKSNWQLPDFSFCTANSLYKSEIKFQRLQLGYVEGNELQYLSFYHDYLLNQISTLLPGEGARILTMTNDIINYVNSTRRNNVISNATSVVFGIADAILKHNNSLINQMQVVHLQQVIGSQISWSKEILNKLQSYHQSFKRIDVSFVKLDPLKTETNIPLEKQNYPLWYSYKLSVVPLEKITSNETLILSCVVYQDLKVFLPSRSVIRLQDGTEMEYEIISKIAAVWLSNSENDRFLFVMEFDHPSINNTSNQWNINCSSANYANYGYMWSISYCLTKIINSTRTKCSCYKPGTYAVFVTTMPVTIAKEEIYSYQQLVLIGCCFCFVFAAISTVILTMYWFVKKSPVTFLKIQYCVAIGSAMMIFVIALSRELSSESYSYINTFLEISLLVSMASHISKCLIVFTEFDKLSKTPNLNKAIVAISTGVPIITVFASHLTHRTMGKRQSSWWLINGSVSFNIFISAALVKIFVYNVMYVMVMEKLSEVVNDQDKSAALAVKRKGLLRRSFSIFWSTVMMIFSSVMYINVRESQVWNYTFAISSILLAMIFFTSYIYKPEISYARDLLEVLSFNSDNKCSTDAQRSPQNALPEANFNKQDTLRRKSTDDQTATNSKLSDLQNIPNCAQNYSSEAYNDENVYNTSNKEGVSTRNRQIGKFQSFKEHLRQQDETSYSCNQQNYHFSPDVVATRVHVELDLVTPIVHDPNCDHKSPDEPPIILCNIAVNSRCNGKQFPLLPAEKSVAENFENVQKVSTVPKLESSPENSSKSENVPAVPKPASSDSLDGMLDKISHDLDYLLNRKKSTTSLAKLEEEDEDEEQEEHDDNMGTHAF